MGTSPIPDFGQRTPPLGGATCPDNFWNAGRSLVLQGPMAFVGAHWALTAGFQGQPASSPPLLPPIPIPPGVDEGSIPYSEITEPVGIIVPIPPPDDAGYTAFADEV